MIRHKIVLLLVMLLTIVCGGFSQQQVPQLSERAKVSLLTASPWDGAVYTLYGHTAIRIEDDSLGYDAVFNYGYFDSSQPNFMWHFVLGQTDYILGVTSMFDFFQEYASRGQEVISQELNFNLNEKQDLFEALYINALPENRQYRYDYFFDNCATRPRDIIERSADGDVVYSPLEEGDVYTFRKLLHECLQYYPSARFGVDLVIGADADKAITQRETMFLPNYLRMAVSTARVEQQNSGSKPLLLQEQQLTPNERVVNQHPLPTPMIISVIVLLCAVAISIMQIRKRDSRLPKAFDTLLYGIFGIAGVIICFLIFFSAHPATSNNWNSIWLNPFALLAAILFGVKRLRNAIYFYHFINFVVLLLFVLFCWIIPQDLPLESIPLALALGIRSAANYVVEKNNRQQ